MSKKKTKRIISLILALTMIFTFMAMSASAAMTEVQPRGTCPQCINGYVTTTDKLKEGPDLSDYIEVGYGACGNMTMPHAHFWAKYDIWVDCNNCSYYGVSHTYSGYYYCPYE